MKVTLITKNKLQVKKLEELAKEWNITLSKEMKEQSNDIKMHQEKAWEAIRELREMDAFADIEDPVEWQREQRKDRKFGWNE